MAVNAERYVPKLERLLEKFAEPNFEIENDVYLNTLLSNIAGKENKGRVATPHSFLQSNSRHLHMLHF